MEETRDFVIIEEKGQEEGLKAARKHFSKLGWMFIAGTIVIYAVQLVPIILIRMVRPQWLWDANISLLLSMLPMYLVGMPVLILLVRQVPADVLGRHQMKKGKFFVAAIMCFALVYLCNLLGNFITTLIGIVKGSDVENQLSNVISGVNLGLLFLFVVICAPIMEEFVFRKLVVDRTVHYGQGVAVLVSGLMFGLFHGNLNQFAYAFTLGMFLAYLYVKTGNLKITIALHMMINFMGGVVSSWLMQEIDIDEYLNIAMNGMDMTAMMSYMMEHLLGWIIYLVYLLFVFGVMIAGAVLLIVSLVKKRFTFDRGVVVIPKGKRFRTVIFNVGMMAYCIFWIAIIIWQLLL